MAYGRFLGAALKSLLEAGGQKLSSLLAAAPLLKAAIALNFLNLAGLPPLSGFFAKLLLLKGALRFGPVLDVLLLLLQSLVVLYAYLVITYYLYRSPFPGVAEGGRASFLSAALSLTSVAAFPVFLLCAA
jgi:multicomponent Na+:H+ antiporter subunit D